MKMLKSGFSEFMHCSQIAGSKSGQYAMRDPTVGFVTQMARPVFYTTSCGSPLRYRFGIFEKVRPAKLVVSSHGHGFGHSRMTQETLAFRDSAVQKLPQRRKPQNYLRQPALTGQPTPMPTRGITEFDAELAACVIVATV